MALTVEKHSCLVATCREEAKARTERKLQELSYRILELNCEVATIEISKEANEVAMKCQTMSQVSSFASYSLSLQ